MSDCEYEQEDFCLFEDMEGFDAKCSFKDKDGHCTAKPDDLESCCEFCGSPDCYNDECLEEPQTVTQKDTEGQK